ILAHYKAATQTNPIQGVGHADLVQAHDGSWWLVCLGFRTQSGMHHLLGRETFLAPVRWDKGAWPVVNGTGDIALDMNVSTLPQKPFPARPDRYEFDEEKLGNEWSWLRNPDMSKYVLENGSLRLYGTGTDLDLLSESPTFVGLRQQDISFTAETCVKLEKARNDDKAGVTVFMDSGAHYDIYLTKKGAKWYVGIRYAMGVLKHVEEEVAGGSKVYFRITGDPDFYRFWYSEDGKEYKQLGANHTRYLSSETIGGFTGIMLGLWAQSQSEKGWAEFEYFEYKQM
ncbi:MAG: family 43 glycosylhydrolase, partial [Bacteroidales bacterium]|nr:family 43 glycosylhydrolase [Bacteroidales bacterium]